ncbi:MAG: AmmeMemoRadiSam system protein B [Ignavibacteriales bacterium]|nr:AmmeMemoRadiSam system protein B [Ignavibacteriales bacterium]
MKSFSPKILLILAIIFFSCDCKSQNKLNDRQPAVAGQFYPADPTKLKADLEKYFSSAVQPKNFSNVIAIIAPHAGYVFSGEVAASSYNQIDPDKDYENIFILGISHRVGFEGASVYSIGNFITPLGTAKVNTEVAKELIKKSALFSARTDAQKYEHSVEVQVPFLQYRLKKDFKIIPIVLGTNPPDICKNIAEVLKPYFNSKNLFIISTDFSHYPKYKDAVEVDKLTAEAVLANSPEKLLEVINANEQKGIAELATCMCGEAAVLTLLYMTENNPDIAIDLVQYKNSGDTQYGDKNQVVGYNSIVFSLKESKSKSKIKSKMKNEKDGEFNLDENDKRELLSIARNTVKLYVGSHQLPEVDEKNLSDNLKTKCGAFVTLKKNGELRGCIGRFDAAEPLYKIVQQMVVASSTQDYRFSPVEPNEVDKLEIEISVLTPMKKINSIDEIVLGKHGIYVKKGMSGGTFLPQVATETGWTKEEFLGHCAQDKAGIGWNGWKDADIFIYEALVFGENELWKK